MTTQCGNPRHPAGAWHQADPVPLYRLRNVAAHVRRWRRGRRYGCPCPPDAASAAEIRARRHLRSTG